MLPKIFGRRPAHNLLSRRVVGKSVITLLALVTVLAWGVQGQVVGASWASDSSAIYTVNTSGKVKVSTTIAPISFQVVNAGAGGDSITDVNLTLTGASSFDPAADLAALTTGSETSGIGLYVDSAPLGSLGAEDQALALSPGPSYVGSGPWTVDLNPVNANIASGITKNYLLVVRTDSSVTDGAQFRVGLTSVVYNTAGTKTDLAVNAPGDATYYSIDTTVPTISSRVTKDFDGNGLIDAIKVTMSESILDSTLTAGNFAVAGYTVASISGTSHSSTANDNIFYLALTEGAGACSSSDASGCDTDAVPNVTYTAGTLTDHAGNALGTTGAVASTDGAAPVVKYSKYKDSNNDGRVDRVDVTFSENVVSDGYNGADYVATTAGTVTLTSDTAVAVSGDDLQVSILGTAGITGGTTAPVLAYTDNFVNTSRGLNDASNNEVATFSTTVGDGAKPVIKTVTIEDANSNGLIDKLTYTWTENVDTDDSVPPVSSDTPTTLLPDGQTATFGSATFSDPNGASAAWVVTGVTGQVTKNTAAGSTAISGDLSAKWVDGAGNAAHVTGATANETIVDSAAPVLVSSTGNDTPSFNDAGVVNRYRLVFSEDLMDVDSGAVDHPNFSVVNTTNSNAITITSADIYLGAGGGGPAIVQVVLDQSDPDNYTGPVTFSYDALASGNKIQDNSGNLTASMVSVALTDDVLPVLLTSSAVDVGGTSDVLDSAGDYILFKFSEPMALPTITNLEHALFFSNGATDVDATDSQNLHTTGGSDNTVSRTTTGNITNNTIKVIRDQDNSTNLLTPGTHKVRLTSTGVTDVATNAGDFSPVAITIIVADVTAPTFSSRVTKDFDGNGKIDAIKVTMSESILDNSLTAANFTVAGYTVTSVSGTTHGSSANDSIFYLALTETSATCTSSDSTGCDTDAVPNVTYTLGTMTDASSNSTASTGAVASTDGAAPVPMYAVYKDVTSVDGQVDRVDITFSENIVSDGYNGADYAASTPGTINLAADSAVAVSGDDLRITILGDANKTGGSTNPQITYTDNFVNTSRGLNDASNIEVPTFTITATDGAAPFYVSSQTLDNNNDGTADFIKVVYSESVLDSTVASTDFATGIADTTGSNLAESFTSAVPASGNATDTANDATVYIGVTSSGETITAKKTDYTLKIQQVGAVTDAIGNSYASFVLKTSTDGEKPIIKTVTIEDAASGDGLIDKLTFTWSENIDTDDSSAPVAADLPTTLLPDGSTADFTGATISDPNGASAAVVVTSVAGQVTVNTAAGSTAVSGDLSAKWVDGASNAPHATGGTGNETITDSAKPVFKTSTTSDTNTNGTVDHIALVFSEPVSIADGSAGDGLPGVAFANSCTAANADYATSSTSSLTVTVTGCTASNTSITASPTYTAASGDIIDKASGLNEMANAETVTGTDGAGPAILTATVNDADADGDMDTIALTYSENLTNTAAAANGFDITSATNHGTCNTESADPAVSSSLSLTFVCSGKYTAVGDMNLVFTANSGLVDSAGNQSPTETLTSASTPAMTDIAAPIPLSVSLSKAVVNGNIPTAAVVTVTFSEPITATGVANGDWKVSRNASESLSTANWPDGSSIGYGSGASTVTMTLTGATTSGGWGPYTSKFNLNADNTASIVDASTNQADKNPVDISVSGIVGPTVDAVAVVGKTNTTATISWITGSASTSNKIKYGTTTSVGSNSTSGTPGESGTTHSINLTGLTGGTLYYYQACSTNSSEACSTINNFTSDSSAATLATTNISAVRSYATVGGTFSNGFAWTFYITVPTSETLLQLKFSDFVSGSNSIAVASNIRYYSAQSSNAADSDSPITISAANTYGTALILTSDLDSVAAGRQVAVTVEEKVPSSTAGGSYSGSYGLFSATSGD